jgi:putative transposase
MPWRHMDAKSERLQFVRDARNELMSFTELCALYQISRITGYKWVKRAEQSGLAFLDELSRRPHSCPHATPPALQSRLLEARRRHPTWGPRKLLALVQRGDRRHDADFAWPARSTVAELLRRNGLTAKRRRRHKRPHPGRPLTPMTAPNVIWTADFKGQFRVGTGQYCYPLTVQDGFSRYLLGCRGLTSTSMAESRPVFQRLFQEYGLPEIIRSDNGVPFATSALAAAVSEHAASARVSGVVRGPARQRQRRHQMEPPVGEREPRARRRIHRVRGNRRRGMERVPWTDEAGPLPRATQQD